MTGLVADVFVLIVIQDGLNIEVAARWDERGAEQALLAWFEREFDETLPEEHQEALDVVHDTLGALLGRYRYEIVECRVSDL